MDEFVTQTQFAELRSEMNQGFNDIKNLINQIKADRKLDDKDNQIKYDERYRLKCQQLTETIMILDHPDVKSKASRIIDDYMYSEDAEKAVAEIYRKLLRNARDESSKWFQYIKLLAGILATGVAIYFGVTINDILVAIQKIQ